MNNTLAQKVIQKHSSPLFFQPIYFCRHPLCFKDSGHYRSILSSKQFFSGTCKLKKYEIYLILVIRFPARCCQQEATTTRFKRQKEQFASSAFDLLWVHALITLGSYLQPLLPDHNLVSYSQKKTNSTETNNPLMVLYNDWPLNLKNILNRIQILHYFCLKT